MMSDEYLVECKIDDDDDDDDYGVQKIQPSPPPPPQFSSSPSITPQPTLIHVDIRDPCGVNKHLKVSALYWCAVLYAIESSHENGPVTNGCFMN